MKTEEIGEIITKALAASIYSPPHDPLIKVAYDLLTRTRQLEEGIRDVLKLTENLELNQLHIKRELQKLLEESK